MHPKTFADGSPCPKPPPENAEEVIKLIFQTSWPFERCDDIAVEIMTCSGSVPKRRQRDGKDHGAWIIADVTLTYPQGNAISVETLNAIDRKLGDITGFSLESMSFRAKPLEGKLAGLAAVEASVSLADWKSLVLHE